MYKIGGNGQVRAKVGSCSELIHDLHCSPMTTTKTENCILENHSSILIKWSSFFNSYHKKSYLRPIIAPITKIALLLKNTSGGRYCNGVDFLYLSERYSMSL